MKHSQADSTLLEQITQTAKTHTRKWSYEDLCPADKRIADFLKKYLKHDTHECLPPPSLILHKAGLARTLSLPKNGDHYNGSIVQSYRIQQGVLHNPKSDRRTTAGVFHVAQEGLPIPDDKISVDAKVFEQLFKASLTQPRELLELPYTHQDTQDGDYHGFVSILMRPVVCPEIEGLSPHKSLEVRFFAPAGLVSNLDFVESIFGNDGDPYDVAKDAGLDTEHWTGHSGFVLLAPHLCKLTKKELGLPPTSQATARQKRDHQCWDDAKELYNDGKAFKITARDKSGVIVTLIADNYFGYCKKEIKTQISFSANLFGLCEEEHSGGAIAFAGYDLGEEFELGEKYAKSKNTFADVLRLLGDTLELKLQGHAVLKNGDPVIFVPEDAKFSLEDSSVSWTKDSQKIKIRLMAEHTYVLPSGYRVFMKKQTGGRSWHLVGISPDAVNLHKPCTVSGGGKSEISKSLVDAMIQGPVFTANFYDDLKTADEIIRKDYSQCKKKEFSAKDDTRSFLSTQRSLGSVIKLLTPSEEYTDAYNGWLLSLPDHIKDIVFCVKRFYHPNWGEDWQKFFSVDVVNGQLGHELKFNGSKLIANYLRIGKEIDSAWRIFRVRPDFTPSQKIQSADDITASVVVPRHLLSGLDPELPNHSVKLIHNCEAYLFQRPDDAIIRGYDKQAEMDICGNGVFLSNYEPLDVEKAREIFEDSIGFESYTQPVKDLIMAFLAEKTRTADYICLPSHPRIVDGKPSKNPRYLQKRPDIVQAKKVELAKTCVRLFRGLSWNQPVYFPITAVLPGRRNNAADKKLGVPSLAVYNPIHYQELPELFLDFICSLTGKSPSTTGFGSEGALTKGPFNALLPIIDLNNALSSFILSEYDGFSSAAGTVGPNFKVEHDISLLVPEIWCRMKPAEQNPRYLIQKGFLEPVCDFIYQGRKVPASLLGYRITASFANAFLGRIFSNPNIVFTPEMLKPETQDLAAFVEGIDNIVLTQKRVAEHYFDDGSLDLACPPLRALLHIMKDGHYEQKDIHHPDIRCLFTRQAMLGSHWYQQRLACKQERDIKMLERRITYLTHAHNLCQLPALKQKLENKLKQVQHNLTEISACSYRESLSGTLGADVF